MPSIAGLKPGLHQFNRAAFPTIKSAPPVVATGGEYARPIPIR